MSTFRSSSSFQENESSSLESILHKIEACLEKVTECNVSELEDHLNEVLLLIKKTLDEIYIKNNEMIQARINFNSDLLMSNFTRNFQVALDLMKSTSNIMVCVMKKEPITLCNIVSLPVCVSHILFSTFEHCKNGQKFYSVHCKSVVEILELFRKTQDVHAKFLLFLNSHLVINITNGTETDAYKDILVNVVKISKTLLGINMKSLVDNWKCIITLLQKYYVEEITCYVLSFAITILTEEINNNLVIASQINNGESEKDVTYMVKTTGILIKVVLKLIETEFDISKSYEDITNFWIMIFGWQNGYFLSNRFPGEITDFVGVLNNLCSESLSNLLHRDRNFILCLSTKCDYSSKKNNFGFLVTLSTALRELPKLKYQTGLPHKFKIDCFLRKVFKTAEKCYDEYFYDFNSRFYDDLTQNLAIAILIFPNSYSDIANLLLETILSNNIWTALIAVDCWCSALKHATEKSRHSTYLNLIKQLEGLGIGIFTQNLELIPLKILVQRIFQMLPDFLKNEEMKKYNPETTESIWRILSFKNITPCHRFYTEFLLCDILDKTKIIEDGKYSSQEALQLVERLNIISYTNFNYLQINPSQLVQPLKKLWSFDVQSVSPSNNFFKLFLAVMVKATIAIAGELDSDFFCLVFTQMKSLLSNTTFKLYVCDILGVFAKKKVQTTPEINTVICYIYKILLVDRSAIVVQTALQSFNEIFLEPRYKSISHNILNSCAEINTSISDYTNKSAAKNVYDAQNFAILQSFTYQHQCLEWSSWEQPARKKIKLDVNVDSLINDVKAETEKLVEALNGQFLQERQKVALRDIIKKLNSAL